MNNLEFLIFYILCFLSGRGLSILYLSFNKNQTDKPETVKVLNTDLSIFYTIISLVFFGNLIFLINFVLSINEARFLLICLFALSILINIKRQFQISDKFRFIFMNSIIPLLLSFSVYGNRLHADAGYYHLPHQLWIRNEKIIFGLGKLDMYFGTSSMYEYLSSVLWINESFNFLHNLNLIFFVLFFSFVTFHLTKQDKDFLFFSSFILLIYSLLDNVGMYGGSNGFIKIQTVGKPDVAVGVLIYIVSVTLIQKMINKNFDFDDFLFSVTLATFTFQIRIFGAVLFLVCIIYFLSSIKRINSIPKKFIYVMSTNIFIFIAWSIKNLIISSCLIFPIKQTCIKSLQWSNFAQLNEWSNSWNDWPYNYKFNKNFFDWTVEWFNAGTNFQEVPNYLISVLVIYLLNRVVFTKEKSKNYSKIFVYIYFLIGLFFFLLFGFHIRYMFGFVLLSVAMLTLNNKKVKRKNNQLFNLKIIYSLIFISVFLIPRGYSYKYFLDNPNIYYYVEVSEEIDLIKNEGWGNYSSSNKCYDTQNCTRTKSNLELVPYFSNYLIFEDPT